MRKENPKKRWHLTAEEIEQIRKLTLQGMRQGKIAKLLHLGRDTVGQWQVRMGLPTVPPIPEEEILKLFKLKWGGYRIAKHLHVPRNQVYAIAHEHGLTLGWSKTPPENEARFIEALKRGENYRIRLARKYGVAICRAREIAKQVLKTERFRPGLSKPPLSSDFPQRHHPRGGLST
jgi:hypothetical protein